MDDYTLSTSAPPSPRPITRSSPPAREEVRSSSLPRPTMILRTGPAGLGFDADAGGREDETFEEWLARYRIGLAGAPDAQPEPPPSILAILEGREVLPSADQPSSDSSPATSAGPSSPTTAAFASSVTSSASATSLPSLHSLTAATLLDFYRKKGHFPAPPGPYEEERLRLAHKYGLDQPIRRKAIDRICGLAKRYFRTKSVVISLTFDDHQVLGAERGWGREEPGLDVPPRPLTMEPAFCTHAMLASYRDPKSVFIVSDADQDWRFKANPYTVGNGGGLSFYAAANVNLPVPESVRRGAPDLPPTLASGALCLIDSIPRAPEAFTEEDREVLTDMAAMISREFQLGFEQRRREQEAAQSDFVGTFLHQALVMPPQPGDLKQAVPDPDSPPKTPPVSSSTMPESDSAQQPSSPRPSATCSKPARPRSKQGVNGSHDVEKESLFAVGARQLRSLTHAGSAAIIDLRAFRSAPFSTLTTSSSATNPQSPVNPSQRLGAMSTPALASALSSTSVFDFSVPPSRPSSAGNGAQPLRRESLNSQFWRSSGPQINGRGKVGLAGSNGNIEWVKIFKRSGSKSAAASPTTGEHGDAASPSGSAADETDGDDSGAENRGRSLEHAVQDTLKRYYEDVPETPEACTLDAIAFVRLGVIPPEKASSSICVPVFDVDGLPAVLIVLTSGEKWFDFEPTDRRFASSVGAILVGSLLRQRALEADRAKLAFVSQVSHELRTPCHGVNSQIELIREFASPHELRRIAPLLDAADTCLESLRDVLDDTLDFSKLTNASPEEAAELARRALVPADLESLAEGVMRSTWVRKQRSDLVTADVRHAVQADPTKVKLVLEVEERKGGWGVLVDVGGLKRILLNLTGNAFKFCHEGEVKLSIRELGVLPSGSRVRDGRTRRVVSITVRDTGIGMKADFVRNGSFLLPFVQADPFAPGAGLGLSICDNIIKRLGGKLDVWSELGVGTSFTATLPLEFTAPPEAQPSPARAPSLPRIKRRVISDELAALLQPRDLTPSDSRSKPILDNDTTPTPATADRATDHADFSAAVAATQASLAPRMPIKAALAPPTPPAPSLAPSTLTTRVLGGKADAEDLVVEAAKLSLSSSSAVATASLPAPDASTFPTPSHPVKAARRKVKVLCAEDNPIARNILVKLFTGKSIDFAAAEDGQEALELFEQGGGSYTLCLIDVQMPRLDGIEASTAMRKVEAANGWAPTRIIALTGLSGEQEMQKALGAEGPVNSWLVKGGKSLRVIIDEIQQQQRELDDAAAE
ncbi:hypothetical protein JCM8097_005344 [Rhodosporidiobolus ruineniae]